MVTQRNWDVGIDFGDSPVKDKVENLVLWNLLRFSFFTKCIFCVVVLCSIVA